MMNLSRLFRTIKIRPKLWANLSTSTINQSLYNFSEEEQMIKETVSRFGKEHVEPYIHEMEEAGAFKPELMKAIFDQGVSVCLSYPYPIRYVCMCV